MKIKKLLFIFRFQGKGYEVSKFKDKSPLYSLAVHQIYIYVNKGEPNVAWMATFL